MLSVAALVVASSMLASGGAALLGQGKLGDGVEYVRVIGWEADSKNLVETWYLANGTHLTTRFQEISEHKISGNVTLADGKGQSAKGTFTREKISNDEGKATYRGRLPGQTDEVVMTWTSRGRSSEKSLGVFGGLSHRHSHLDRQVDLRQDTLIVSAIE